MDQFCLKWNNFQTSLVTAFSNLQSTEELADVTLTCEGQSIKAHKIILSACSPYFRNVFKDNPCSHPIVILKDVLHSDLLAILNFMYHGEVLITQDRLASFLQTAEALQVSGLVSSSGLHEIPVKYVPYQETQIKKSKRAKKVTPKSETENKFEVQIDSIKNEIENVEDVECTNNNISDKSDAYDKQGSILETVLEVKDKEVQPSILERSLTAQAIQQANPLEHNLESDKRGTKHKTFFDAISVASDLPHKQLKTEEVVNIIPNEVSLVRSYQEIQQPHHSSQCGNCPHCGKVYSNQSALKYHVRLVHSDLTNMYCCHLCPEAFDFREGYKKHMAEAHSVRN